MAFSLVFYEFTSRWPINFGQYCTFCSASGSLRVHKLGADCKDVGHRFLLFVIL